MGRLYPYSFEDIVLEVNGLRITGFADGDNAIELAPNSDRRTFIVGADGETTASKSADRGRLMTIRLMPDSPGNRILQQLDDRNSVFGVSLRNTGNLGAGSLGEGGAASQCQIATVPSKSLGTNATPREWTLFCADWADTPLARI
jgi:hypothetical protein